MDRSAHVGTGCGLFFKSVVPTDQAKKVPRPGEFKQAEFTETINVDGKNDLSTKLVFTRSIVRRHRATPSSSTCPTPLPDEAPILVDCGQVTVREDLLAPPEMRTSLLAEKYIRFRDPAYADVAHRRVRSVLDRVRHHHGRGMLSRPTRRSPCPITIENAKDLETLGKVVSELAKKSTETYTTASVSMWKMLAGDEKWDAEKLTKSATKIVGQAAADANNAGMMLQKLVNLATQEDGAKPMTSSTPPPAAGPRGRHVPRVG